MVDYIALLPMWIGCSLTMVFIAFSSLVVYFVSYKLIENSKKELQREPINNLFRFVGIFVSLMLSLSFNEVINEWDSILNSIDREAAALSDTYINLKYFDEEGTRDIRALLIEYAHAIIDDDWSAMAQDRLGQRTTAIKRQFTLKIAKLRPNTPVQEKLWSDIDEDVDTMSDYRLIRLNHAASKPPVFVMVIILGVLLAMACLGVYRPHFPLVGLFSLCTLFIGMVLYMILAMSDPFKGVIIIEPTPFTYLIEAFESGF